MPQNNDSHPSQPIYLTALCISIFLLATLASARDPSSTVLQYSGRAYPEKRMPDFAGIELSKPGAEVISLDDVINLSKDFPEGRVVLNFFSTTCIPCLEGLTELQANSDQLKKEGINVLLVAVGDTRETIRKYLTKKGLTFVCVWDRSGQISKNYGVIPPGGDLSSAKVPLTAVADNKGKLLRIITAEGDDYLEQIRKGK
jgi:peroxiredoxin